MFKRKRKLNSIERDEQATAAYVARSRAIGEGGPEMRGWQPWQSPLFAPDRRVVKAVRALVGLPEKRAITAVPWDAGGPGIFATQSPEQMLQLVPVYAATRLIAETLSTLPLQAFRKTADDKTEKIPVPPLFTSAGLQGGQPGVICDWVYSCLTSLLLRGNAYGYITSRDRNEYPTNIEWIDPVRVDCQGTVANPVYFIDGQQVKTENVLHIRAYVLPGKVEGLSPISNFATTFGMGLHAQEFGFRWFENGGMPPGTFKNIEWELNPEEEDAATQRLVARIRAGKPLVFGKDWEFDAITMNPGDAKLVETLQLTATDVAAIYGILQPEMIGGSSGDSMTYANVEQRAIDFAMMTIRPWAYRLESAFFQCIPRPQFVRFNLDALVRADLMTRHQVYAIDRNIGLRNVDEERELENLPPLPKGEGKDYTPLIVLGKGAAGSSGGTAGGTTSGSPDGSTPDAMPTTVPKPATGKPPTTASKLKRVK